MVDSLKALKNGGKSIVVGIFEDNDIQIPANIFVQKEVALIGSQGGYRMDFHIALKLIGSSDLKLGDIITHTLPLSELQKAFELLLDPNSNVIKAVIQMD